MWLINLTISLFSILKVKTLECVSVVNQKCMPRPKILDVNEGIGEALFYPYKMLVNKGRGSCNTLDNPMSEICVPVIVKNVNMQVYNFLMRLNETRNVLWHESCKCVCKLSSSVCNNKQIWNSDTCTCDCNEDFGKKFVLSLHYNGDISYLFVNGRQELQFKAKTDQLVKEKLCIGNLSDQWTTSESEKTGAYGKIYDFVVDYEQISGVKTIYDMHRYLIIKHNINP